MKLGERAIGLAHEPFVIAEMSGNHNGSLERALEIVDAAADAGAHALKLQTYTADTMTLDVREPGFVIDDPRSLWEGRSLYELYGEAHTPWEWHEPIFRRARERGVLPLSTPFDDSAVDFLERLGAEVYKIASFELTDLALIRRVAATRKPVLMSTGMATAAEIDEAVRAARTGGATDVVLLKCTSAYPASPEHANLATLQHMREMFGCEVGLSDHTLGVSAAVCAVALGATVIEKHFTVSRADGGVDAAFSLEPNELRLLVSETRAAWQAIGRVSYGASVDEARSLQYRRSLYFVRELEPGERISPESIRAIRPGFGLPTRFLDVVVGMRVREKVRRGQPVTWDVLR
jgi:N-acetylneuraminate synthase